MSDLGERLRGHGALAVVALVYIASIVLLVPPADSYPLGDDWDYAATAVEFAQTGRMELGPWPAMTLVSHVAWGAAFLCLFGQGWSALVASMMVMAWMGGLAIYVLARDGGRPPVEAALLCGSYVAAPLVVSFSYSFYTDVTATSLMLVTVAVIPRALRRDSLAGFVGLGLAAGVAFMARQTAAIPALVLILLLLFRKRWSAAGVIAVAAVVPAFGCYVWLLASDGLPSGFGKISYDFAVLTDMKSLVAKLVSILLEVGLLVLPLAVLWLSSVWSARKRVGRLRSALLALLWIGFVLAFAAELRPYRGWSFYDCGLGILPTYAGAADALGSATLIGEISVFQGVTLALAAFAVLVLVGVGWQESSVADRPASDGQQLPSDTQRIIVLSTVLYLCLLLILEFVYDRYLIPLVGLVLAMAATKRRSFSSRRDCSLSSVCVLLVFGGSLLGVQDQITVKRVYWDALAALRSEGVPLEQIEHGLVKRQEDARTALHQGDRGVCRSGGRRGSACRCDSPYDRSPVEVRLSPGGGVECRSEIRYSTWLREGRLLVLYGDVTEP